MEKGKTGFTILETVLVVAIATLLFMSVTLGIGSRIANGRYETASNEITNYIQNAFAETLNVENQRIGVEGAREYCTLYGSVAKAEGTGNRFVLNKADENKSLGSISETNVYPGRTACAIYGKILFFGATDGKVHIFDVVGDTVTADRDQSTNISDLERLQDATIEEQLDYVRADFVTAMPENLTNGLNNCSIRPAANYSTYDPNWGALFKTANYQNTTRSKDSDFIGFIMIVRAPISGDVHTFFYEGNPGVEKWDFDSGISNFLGNNIACGDRSASSYQAKNYYSPLALLESYKTDQEALPEDDRDKNRGFCVGSDDFYISISNSHKFVEIVGDGQNAAAIKLDESGGNPCQQ